MLSMKWDGTAPLHTVMIWHQKRDNRQRGDLDRIKRASSQAEVLKLSSNSLLNMYDMW